MGINKIKLVTVIIPTYNYAGFIVRCIESVLQQVCGEISTEIIIVDDGSTDNTKEVIANYILAQKVHYYYQPNQGKAVATALAISMAKGEIIFNLDADDFFLPGKIKSFVKMYDADSDLVHVASAALIMSDSWDNSIPEKIAAHISNKSINGLELLKYFFNNNKLFGGGSTFSARSTILKSLIIPAGVDMYIDEFLLLATLQKGNSYIFNETFSVWFVHENNYSGTVSADKLMVKNNRLISSSFAVLNYVEENFTELFFKKIYRLQHANRIIFFKEQEGCKNITDVLHFSRLILISNFYNPLILFRYKIFNRMMPQVLIKFMKRTKLN